MNTEELKKAVVAAVSEYVAATEAWDDAQLAVDTATGAARIVEEEDAETLPDSIDIYDIMDLVEMDSEGVWKPDMESIDGLVSGYA
ncbi:MAG: hypothetical protein K2L59_04640 [Muribaculaceae bacterium]|nr:hypothetical protein [Muribaculaceae bacterium]